MRAGWMVAAVFGALASVACGGGASSSVTSSGSASSSGSRVTTSHNAGRDCTACHREFAIAGTVYKTDAGTPLTGATIRLTSAADGAGAVLLSLTSDGSGNFYTRQSVGFGSGVYVDVAGASGTRRGMKAAVTSGACNSCHGGSQRVTAN